MQEMLRPIAEGAQTALEASYAFLTQQLHIHPYLIKLFVTFVVVLLVCAWVLQLSRHLSKRDLFSLDLGKYDSKTGSGALRKASAVFLYIIEYLILFPIYTLFWGGVLVFLLILMAVPEAYPNVIFFATVIMAAIRAIAYFNEQWANTLAMQLPILMLVTTVLNPTVLAKVNASTITLNLPYLLQTNMIIESIAFVVVMEWLLRISTLMWRRERKKQPSS